MKKNPKEKSNIKQLRNKRTEIIKQDMQINEIAEKISLIEKFCGHILQGYSKDSFAEAGFDKIRETANYLDEYHHTENKMKTENSPAHISYRELIMQAVRISRKKWEEIGLKAVGNRTFNAAVWKHTGWNNSDTIDGIKPVSEEQEAQNKMKTIQISFAKREDYENSENESDSKDSEK